MLKPTRTPAELIRQYVDRYKAAEQTPQLRMLIAGAKCSGKTHLAFTCIKPLLIDMFDPGGEDTLQSLIESGDAIVRRYYEGTPAVLQRWIDDQHADMDSGILPYIGTRILDSVTTWGESVQEYILQAGIKKGMVDKDGNFKLHPDLLIRQDWGEMLSFCVKWCKLWQTYPCDVLWLSHLRPPEVDEALAGRKFYGITINGQSQDRIPNMFSEYFTLEDTPYTPDSKKAAPKTLCPDGRIRFLRTRPEGMYRAGTRRGGSKGATPPKFDMYEVPDIKALRAKIGLSVEDKQPLAEALAAKETTSV